MSFLQKSEGVLHDFEGAAHYFKLAADQGHSTAQTAYAVLLWDGRVISKDLIKAIHYFDLAANQRLAGAQYRLGICFHNFFCRFCSSSSEEVR
jgi:TPR repeat protein